MTTAAARTARSPSASYRKPMLTIGIDPDTRDFAYALWDEGPVAAHVIHVKGRAGYQMIPRLAETVMGSPLSRAPLPVVVAVEGQQVDRRVARPRDLFKLAHITGAAALWITLLFPDARVLIPTPTEWKGQIAKHAHQARLYDELGWGYEVAGSGKGRYARPLQAPKAFSHITKGQWKHVGDAMLLARWAQDQ